jgi:hypothetical protein
MRELQLVLLKEIGFEFLRALRCVLADFKTNSKQNQHNCHLHVHYTVYSLPISKAIGNYVDRFGLEAPLNF